MRRLRPADLALMSGLVSVVILVAAGSAFADQGDGDGWGSVDCTQIRSPSCDVTAGKGKKHSAPNHGGSTGAPKPGNAGDGSGGSAGGTPYDPNPDLNCSYQRSDYRPPPGVVGAVYRKPSARRIPVSPAAAFRPRGQPVATGLVTDPQPGQSGAWYTYKCTGNGVHDTLFRPPVWIPDGPQQGGQALMPPPAQLAQVAHDQLRLPSPRIEANPAGDQLVNLPTWLWLDKGSWGPISATASVPGLSVTATAQPISVDWTMGDGNTVTCTGPGVPYAADGNPKGPSPACGYTYHSSSAGQPGQAYAVRAAMHWTVTWSGAGQAGTFPDMVTESAAAFRVAESQALNSR